MPVQMPIPRHVERKEAYRDDNLEHIIGLINSSGHFGKMAVQLAMRTECKFLVGPLPPQRQPVLIRAKHVKGLAPRYGNGVGRRIPCPPGDGWYRPVLREFRIAALGYGQSPVVQPFLDYRRWLRIWTGGNMGDGQKNPISTRRQRTEGTRNLIGPDARIVSLTIPNRPPTAMDQFADISD